MTKVKICGLVRESDAEAALAHGADYLGFVFEPTSPRYVGSPAWSPEWLSTLEVPKVAVYGVFVGPSPADLDVIQAHTWDLEATDDWRMFRVVRLNNPFESGSVHVPLRPGDAIVLDAYHPTAHGGTGEQVDWHEAAELVRTLVDVKVILAGGLTPENVAEAIEVVRPFAVDVSSGVEALPGVKDAVKIRDFIQAARGA